MSSTEQMPGLSVAEHGEMVYRYYADLYCHLYSGTPLKYEWRLPDWITDPVLMERQLPYHLVRTYQLFHDCGKPYCREVDADGRQHFPNHAEVSHDVWHRCVAPYMPLPQESADQIGRLIRMDMDVHLLKADGVPEFAARPEAMTLLMTGLAEIHANAEMFGGIESTSFKIKWKHLNKRGKAILKLINETE